MAFVDSSPLINDASALQHRAAEDGYLCFKNLVPAGEVLALEQQLVELCRAHGLYDEVIVDDKGRINLQRIAPYYTAAYKLRKLHALPKRPEILGVFERLFGRQPVPHARTVLRTVPFGTNQVWPAHQDMPNISTHDEAWNTWLPIGECPRALGTLSIALGSHKLGLAKSRSIIETGLILDEHPDDLTWVSDDLAPGDVVMFNALTFHRGEPNRLPDRLRLSVDNCIQPIDTEFVRGAFDLHHGDYGNLNQGLTWSDIYANWAEDEPMKYYWHEMPIKIVDPPHVPIK